MMTNEINFKDSVKWKQIVAACSVCLGSFGLGTTLAWSSPALPRLDPKQCQEKNNCDTQRVPTILLMWIGPLMALGALASGPVTGYSMNKLGRRRTMQVYSIPFCVGFLLLAAAKFSEGLAMPYIVVGRLMTGFSGGAFALLAPLYIVETSDPSMRGCLASLMQLSVTLGVAAVNAMDVVTNWTVISGVCAVPPALMALALLFLPESPHHLIAKGNIIEAERSLVWLRGKHYDVASEIEELKEKQELLEREIGFKELMSRREYVRPFLIVLGLMFFQQFSGINYVVFYARTIFADAGTKMQPELCSFLVSVAMVLGTALAVSAVERCGRRPLLTASAALMAAAIAGLAMYFFVKDNSAYFTSQFLDAIGWLPLASLVSYVVAFSIGFGPLPWTVNAEIFPGEARSLASSLAFAFNWACACAVPFLSPMLEASFGSAAAVYTCFAIVCSFGAVFVLIFLPETSGRKPEEIRDLFIKKEEVDVVGKDNLAFVN